MKPSKNTLLLSICKPVKTGFFICQRLQTVSHWLPNGGFEAFIWKWKIAIPSSPRKWETKAAKPLNRYFSIIVYRVYVCTTGEGYFTYSVVVKKPLNQNKRLSSTEGRRIWTELAVWHLGRIWRTVWSKYRQILAWKSSQNADMV